MPVLTLAIRFKSFLSATPFRLADLCGDCFRTKCRGGLRGIGSSGRGMRLGGFCGRWQSLPTRRWTLFSLVEGVN